MSLLKLGDKVGIVACSNGLDRTRESKMLELKNTLNSLGLETVFSDKIYKKISEFNGTGKERADVLMGFFKDKTIKAIFDVSGGDLANEVLDYLNFEIIKNNVKPFFGYSDLSVIVNAIYAKTNIKTYLYKIRNFVEDDKVRQIQEFKNTFMGEDIELTRFNYTWVQGNTLEGIVVGGNIRCLLKLSGTEYMPDFQDKILFLESLSGDVPKMVTYLTQFKQMGVFNKVKGIILGSFSEMEAKNYFPTITDIIKGIVNNPQMPIVKTSELGHEKDSKCIIIGEKIIL